MFKKTIAALLVIAIVISFVGCEGVKKDSVPKRKYDKTDPSAVLEEITNDFNAVALYITEELEKTYSDVGTTFEAYQKNKGQIDEWIELVLSESDALFARTKENSVIYFKLIAADSKHENYDFCNDALDAYYDVVYDDAMDIYYDKVYDDAMDSLYDKYYNGIIDDAYDTTDYDVWSDASSESYQTWSDANSAIYEKWSSESSYVYGLWSAINSAFCSHDNFDVDGIIADYKN